MYLEALSLHNFKNFGEVKIRFKKGITCIIGANGSGKTNLMDSIHYLSLGKSAFNLQDSQNIQHGQGLFSINGKVNLNDKKFSIQCSLKTGQKKILKVDGKETERLSDHVGRYPVVLIAPDDSDLVREHSEARRRFVDGILCQFNADYLGALMNYNNYLKQRNAALKSLSEKKKRDDTLLEAYDSTLLSLNKDLCKYRSEFVAEFIPYLNKFYSEISDEKEKISLNYKSQVKHKDFINDFKKNLERDLFLQRTEMGIHRDDYVFKINSHGLKKFGSQGQQKSFIVSLKLAHFEFLKANKNIKPILLLDDIFDKLDESRIAMLMQLISNGNFGQIFITDATGKRIRDIVKKVKVKASFLCIENNSVKPC